MIGTRRETLAGVADVSTGSRLIPPRYRRARDIRVRPPPVTRADAPRRQSLSGGTVFGRTSSHRAAGPMRKYAECFNITRWSAPTSVVLESGLGVLR